MIKWNEYELAWAAGFFDGEGYSSVSREVKRTGYIVIRMRVSASQTANPGKRILEKLKKTLCNIGGVNGPYRNNNSSLGIYQYNVSTFQECQMVMCLLWKYLSEDKRNQYKETVTKYMEYHRGKINNVPSGQAVRNLQVLSSIEGTIGNS